MTLMLKYLHMFLWMYLIIFLLNFPRKALKHSPVQTSPEGGIRTEKCTQLLTRNIVNVNLHRCHNCYTHTHCPPPVRANSSTPRQRKTKQTSTFLQSIYVSSMKYLEQLFNIVQYFNDQIWLKAEKI